MKSVKRLQPKLNILCIGLLLSLLCSSVLFGQATIGGKVYEGAQDPLTGLPYLAPHALTPSITDAKVMVQNQHSGGAWIAYGTFVGPNEWRADVSEGDFVIMISAPGHDATSREVQVGAESSLGAKDGAVSRFEQDPLGAKFTSTDPLAIDAYLPPMFDLDGGGELNDLPRANLLVYAFYDNKVNGEPDDEPEDLPLNGVTFTVRDEEGNFLASGVTGSQPSIDVSVLPGCVGGVITGTETWGLYYFEGLPPGEVIVTSDPTTIVSSGLPQHALMPAFTPASLFYLNYTEEGGPAWDPKLAPGDCGTEAGNFLIWHSYVEKMEQITPANVAGRFGPTFDLTGYPGNAGTIEGYLTDADKANLAPDEPFPVPGEDHPGVTLNEALPDGLIILFTDMETVPTTRPVATAEADPVTGHFMFTDVPPGRYKMMMFDIPLDYVWTQLSVNLAPNEAKLYPPDILLVPRFFARSRGYVYELDHSVSPPDTLPMVGQEVYVRYKSGAIKHTEITSDGSTLPLPQGPPVADYAGFYNHDNLGEIEVMGNTDVKIPPGYRGAMITERFWPKGKFIAPEDANFNQKLDAGEDGTAGQPLNGELDWIIPDDGAGGIDCADLLTYWDAVLNPTPALTLSDVCFDATHNAANRYINWFTANYQADFYLEAIPAGKGHIDGYIFNDHLSRGDWTGDGVYDREEERTLHGATVELWSTDPTPVLLATTTTGKVDEAAVRAEQGWRGAYQWPGDEFGGVFVGPQIGYYEFRDLAPGSYTVKVIPPAGFVPTKVTHNADPPVSGDVFTVAVTGVEPILPSNGDHHEVNFGCNTTPPGSTPNVDPGVPLAGEIEGGVWDDLNIDGRGGEFTANPTDPRSLMFAEKAAIPDAPVGVYDHLGYFMGSLVQGNPLCHPKAFPGDCPAGADPDQKPEAERRFAPGVHLYNGNDPTLPGHCPNYLPMVLPYTFGQGKHKFEADWSLMPSSTYGDDPCNIDPLISMNEPIIIDPLAGPAPAPGPMSVRRFGRQQIAVAPTQSAVTLSPGDTYRINGLGFGDAQGYQTVTLAGRKLPVIAWTDTYIDVQIPHDSDKAISGPLLVATTTGISNALWVDINYSSGRAGFMERQSVFVDAANTGPEDGSEANPWNTIGEAFDNLPNDPPFFVYVAPGTYRETVQIKRSSVTLIGAGPNVTTINGLPQSVHFTTQGSSNGDGPVIFIGKGGKTGAVHDISISGFTITGSTVNSDDIGAGIFGDYGNYDIDINTCKIYRNGGYYGGGIWLHLSNHNVQIWSNTIAENGNFGGYGGGISVNDEPEYTEEHSQPEHIVDDYNPGPPPGIYEIYNNIIFHNYSPDGGGGICLYEIKDHLKLYGNVLLENKAEDHGGGIFFEETGPIDLHNNVFLRNFNYDDGAAVSFEDVTDTLSHVNVYNNLFAENIADDHGENRARGGAMSFDDTFYAEVFNNTFVGNIVAGSFDPAGGAIDSERHGHEYDGADGPYTAPGYSDPKIYNNIIWDNWRLHYKQPFEGGEEEDLDYKWGVNYVWTPDQLHVDNPHLQDVWETDKNSESFSYVRYNIIGGGYSYNNQPPTADAGPDITLTDSDNDGSESVALAGTGSSDSDGTIVSYTWTEAGAPIASGVNPTISLSVGSHAIYLTVHDEYGASGSALVNLVVNPGGPIKFAPVEDSYVKSGSSKTYGQNTTMRIRSSSTSYSGYLKFSVTGLAGAAQNALVRLFVKNASDDGGSIYLASNYYDGTTDPWDEDGLKSSNAPATTGSALSSLGAVSVGQWVEFDVTSAITGNGTYSFCIKDGSSNSVKYSTKEGSDPPELCIEGSSSGGGGNQPPVANVGPDQTVTDTDNGGTELVTLDGSLSNDPDGTIASHVWSEGGNQIATGANPTVVLPVGIHTIDLTVTDNLGATGTGQVVITVNAGGGGGATTLTLNPTDDAQVKSSKPTKNYATKTTMRLRGGGGTKYSSYVQFNVSGLGGPVQSATLRLLVKDGGTDGGTFYSSVTGWNENTLNYNNAPANVGASLSTVGAVNVSEWVEIDVTSAVAGNGQVSFCIENGSSNSVKYSTKEGSGAPELVIVTGSGGGGGNLSPIANAGTDQNVTDSDNNGSESVALNALLSNDPDGTITSYVWSESGSQVATGVNPAVLLAVGTHFIDLTVTDNLGATGTDQVVVVVNPGAGGGSTTLTFNPTDDAQVKRSKPTKNYVDKTTMRIRKGSYFSYLQFNVTSVTGAVQMATLRLFVKDAGPDGGTFYSVSNAWDESTLNYNNAPAIVGSPVGALGAVNVGEWVEIDVTSAVSGNGTVSFCIDNGTSNSVKYSTKEGSDAPELVVQSATSAPAPSLLIASNGTLMLTSFPNAMAFSVKRDEGGLRAMSKALPALSGASGNLDVDPDFVDPALFNWRLQPGSAAIDKADAAKGPDVDLELLPRSAVNGMIDIGAFEWRANSPSVVRIPLGVLGQVPIPTPGSSRLYP